MRKAIIGITALSALALVITLMVMGLGVSEMDETVIRTTAYLTLFWLALLLGGLLYFRWGVATCPHCGKRLPASGSDCPHCGKKRS